MFYGARCCKAVLDNDTMNYIKFGKGTKPLVILPGLGDGAVPCPWTAAGSYFCN